MFMSEQLQEKWAPLLKHQDLPEINDSHRRAVTAVLLENQEKFLTEQAMLTEAPTNVTAPSGAVRTFDPVLISLIRRSMPNLIAYDIASVQPMSGPTGLIFAMRSRYATPDGAEALFNEPNAGFSGSGASGYDVTASSSANNDAEGSNPAVLNDSGTYELTGDAQGMTTSQSEALGDGTVSYTHLPSPRDS